MMRGRGLVNRLLWALAVLVAPLALFAAPALAEGEDGYDLWLRYAPLEGAELERLRAFDPQIRIDDHVGYIAPSVAVAADELDVGITSLLGATNPERDGGNGIVELACEGMQGENRDRFHIRPFRENGRDGLRITGGDYGSCIYGVFALLRELSLGGDPARIELSEAPAMPLRLLNHWDNPDGHVERGYSGRSIFDWWRLPKHLGRRMIDYARANASLGINGSVVNNVNASPLFLTPRYLPKLKRLADAWRPYGIRLYISARFSAPREIGGLDTADPLDPRVAAWWKAKADEIYAEIPDFGGFLVKANSEGQPGPYDYGRNHADGANMLARAIGNRGTVIWRAFVYSEEDATDRHKQAYAQLVPLDGQFDDNVILQVKNGAIDFQPREPFHPMFGAMPNTKLMLEAQITKEYLGFSTHLAFLAPMWEEVLDADTGHGASVAEVIAPAGMAGVANTGSDRNWSGSHFDQASWYAFGRLAWNPSLSSEQIANEWISLTFGRNPELIETVAPLMLESHQAVVDYMTPMGLGHLMDTGHHYGPAPWVCDLARPEWNPCYYHRADDAGIGFDRTPSGSNALEQYAPAIAAPWSDPATTPEDYLLWFHHLPWDYRTRSGRPLWDELVHRYDRGVAWAAKAREEWARLTLHVDHARHRDVAEMLAIQHGEAQWWRDASIAYWRSLNGLPMPEGAGEPAASLEYYQSLSFPDAPGN